MKAGDTAQSTDFIDVSRETIGISRNTTTGTINIPIISDTIRESDETFTVIIHEVEGATFGNEILSIPVKVTILDDDSLPILSVSNTSQVVSEASGQVSIGLNLSYASERPVLVTYSALVDTGDTATPTDFSPVTRQTFTIPSGTTGINFCYNQ